jgi:hypothetical protein
MSVQVGTLEMFLCQSTQPQTEEYHPLLQARLVFRDQPYRSCIVHVETLETGSEGGAVSIQFEAYAGWVLGLPGGNQPGLMTRIPELAREGQEDREVLMVTAGRTGMVVNFDQTDLYLTISPNATLYQHADYVGKLAGESLQASPSTRSPDEWLFTPYREDHPAAMVRGKGDPIPAGLALLYTCANTRGLVEVAG